jgi:hypothetical protein
MAAAADVIAAECRFNDWIASGKKHLGPVEYPKREPPLSLDEKGWCDLLDAVENRDKKCRDAILAYSVTESQEQLCAELSDIAAFFNKRHFP